MHPELATKPFFFFFSHAELLSAAATRPLVSHRRWLVLGGLLHLILHPRQTQIRKMYLELVRSTATCNVKFRHWPNCPFIAGGGAVLASLQIDVSQTGNL